MAEINGQSIDDLADSAAKARDAIKDADASLIDFSGSLDNIAGPGKVAVDQLINLSDSAANLASSLPGASGAIKSLTNAFQSVKATKILDFFSDGSKRLKDMLSVGAMSEKQMLNLSGSIASVLLVGSGRLKMSDELIKMSKEAQGSSAELGLMYDKLLPLIPGGQAVSDKLKKMGMDFSTMIGQSDAARNLEVAFLRNATAAGDFGDVVRSLRGDFGNLTGKVLEYTNQMADVADANNVSFDTAVRLSNMLREVPGELEMIVRVGGETGKSMNIMSAAMKVAHGTGQDFKDVTGDLNMVLRKFNITGTEAMEVVARMAKAADDIKMPMDLMRDFTQKTAEQFKYLGDNSQAAINVMARFGPALRDSGLGPEGIKDIVTGIVQATGKLDIAQRAFVSAQSGGPGGLAGSFDLALKMQQGRMDEVYADVEKTLKQMMGGQLVTLEEAATDQGAAAQMAKQVQMLTTGPLAIAGTEAEAFKILDAFAKGGMPEMGGIGEAVGTPEDILADTVKTGNDLQAHQLDALNVVRNEAEKQSVIAAFSLDALRKIATGKESTFGPSILAERSRKETRAARRDVIGQVPKTSLTRELDRTAEGIKTIEQAVADKVKEMVAGKPEGAPGEGVTPVAAVTPKYDQDLIAISEGPAKDVQAGAAYMATTEPVNGELERTGGKPSTIIIKVMGKDDVEKMIEVKLNKWGEIESHKELAAKRGLPG